MLAIHNLVTTAPTSFAARLRLARETRGWTGKELATRAGLAQAHVWLLEHRGGERVWLRTADKLAKALRVSRRWLVFGEGAAPAARKARA